MTKDNSQQYQAAQSPCSFNSNGQEVRGIKKDFLMPSQIILVVFLVIAFIIHS